MYKLLLALAAVFVAATEVCEAACTSPGQTRPVIVDFDEVAKKRYSIVYPVPYEIVKKVHHGYKDFTKVGENAYRSTTTVENKDGSTLLINSTVWYTDGFVQEIFDAKDVHGNNYKINTYISAKSDEGALMFRRCDNPGLRKILVPDGVTFSYKELKQLVDKDEKLNYYSGLAKHPNQI